jgi:formate/nitrite transporter FocA (FNT family)
MYVPDDDRKLSHSEQEDAEQRSAISVHVVHEAVKQEGEAELKRSTAALAWSGLAAGLTMGFSLMLEGVLQAHLPDAPWRPLVSKLGYSSGFVMVILARQQLFTENTLTPILPLLEKDGSTTLQAVIKLWVTVLITNFIGAFAIGWMLGNTPMFDGPVRHAFLEISKKSVEQGIGVTMLRGVFAGWLLALMVWLLPFASTSRVFVIIAITWIIGVCGFTHVIAGSVEMAFLATTGAWGTGAVFGTFILPVLAGNIIGGLALVTAINHAQVVS